MKKLAFFALVAIGLMACRSNETEGPKVENDLEGAFPIGAWKYEDIYYIDGKNEKDVLSQTTPESCNDRRAFKFYKNGKFERVGFTTVNGKCVEGDVQDAGTYTYNASAYQQIETNTKKRGIRKYKIQKQEAGVMYIRTGQDNVDKNGDGVKDIPVYKFVKQ